jgi:hypothetical protein
MPCKTSFSYFAGPAKATLHGVVLKIFEKGRFFDLIDENGGEPGVRLEGSGNRRNDNGVWLKGEAAPTGPVSPRPGAQRRPADDCAGAGTTYQPQPTGGAPQGRYRPTTRSAYP